MKDLQKELVNFKVNVVGVAETLPELIEKCGGEERVVDLVNAHILAHSHYTKLRKVIADVVETVTTIKGKDKETVQSYVSRLEEDYEGDVYGDCAEQVLAKTAEVPVDYTARERGEGGSSAPAKKYLAIIDQLIEQNRYEEFLAKYDLRDEEFELDSDEQKAIAAHKAKEIIREREKAAVAAL